MEEVAQVRNGWGSVVIPDQTMPHHVIMMRGEVHDIVTAFSDTGAYICILEALAQVIPVVTLRDKASRFYVSFIDTETAKRALIRGCRSVDAINGMIRKV